MASGPVQIDVGAGYDNLPYHFLSNYYAPSALATTFINAFCLGLVLYDACSNVHFDLYLLRSPGWRRPIKVLNRLTYFSIRIFVILYLVLMMVYLNLEIEGDCAKFFKAMFYLWYIAIAMIDVIFLTRTLALYEWSRVLTLVLMSLYASYVGMGLYGVGEWGSGFRIPGTRFCSYVSESTHESHMERVFKAFFTITTFTDVLILYLTCKRLAVQDERIPQRSSRLSRTLFIQGFVLYGSLLALKLAFILFHYLTDYKQLWLLFGMGGGLTVAYITASILVRQTSNVVQEQASIPTFQTSASSALSPRPISILVEKAVTPSDNEEDAGDKIGFVFAPTAPG